MDLQTRFYASALAILVAGVCAAIAIWFTAGEDPGPPAFQFVAIDGKAVPIEPGQSKQYLREVQRFGGKAGVLFDELNRWFAGLWRGRSLAVTVGWIAVCLSVGLFLLGWVQPAAAEPGDGGEGGPGG